MIVAVFVAHRYGKKALVQKFLLPMMHLGFAALGSELSSHVTERARLRWNSTKGMFIIYALFSLFRIFWDGDKKPRPVGFNALDR